METLYLTREKDKLLKKIEREEALLCAIKNITVIANALKKPNTEGIIKSKLKLNNFQVDAIMKTPIGSLKKKNEKDIKSNIKKFKDGIKVIENSIKHILTYIINTFSEIRKDFKKDKRGTKLKLNGVEIKGTKTGGMYIISDGKNLRKLQRVTGAFKLSHITKDGAGVSVVSDHGYVSSWDLMGIPDNVIDSKYRPIVGLVPFSKDKIVTLTNFGKINIVANCRGKEFSAVNLKHDEYVIKALGMSKDDILIATNNLDKIETIYYEDLPVQRNNTRGKNAIIRTTKNVDIFVGGDEDLILQGKEEIEDWGDLKPKGFYCITDEVYLNKRIKTWEEAKRSIRKKKPSVFKSI